MIPQSIEEAITNILAWEDLEDVINQSLEEFSAVSHFTAGRWIRNQWGLWQQEGGLYKELKGLGLTHADDMSGYIFTLVWCTYHDKPFNMEGVIAQYKEHWDTYGN